MTFIPDPLEPLALFLMQGQEHWHQSVQSLCQEAPFDPQQAARRFCMHLLNHPWTAPHPEHDAQRCVAVLARIIAGDTLAYQDMAITLAHLNHVWWNPVEPIGLYLQAALRGMPAYAAVSLYYSRTRSDRPSAVLCMRAMLIQSVREQQEADHL